MGKEKKEYSYSVECGAIAKLNVDMSVPSPNDWEDEHPITGEVRKHKGGLVGNTGTFNIDGWTAEDLTMGVVYGNKKAIVSVTSTASNKKAVTLTEMVKDLNTAFTPLATEGIKLKATKTVKGADYDDEYLKIVDNETVVSEKLPFFAPIGFSGRLAALLGITGWIFTEEIKNAKGDFEKESGKTVDITSGKGLRCTIKEADKIKGVNVNLSLSGLEDSLLALVTGNVYNEKTGEMYFENSEDTPLLAVRYFAQQYEGGDNQKGNFVKMKMVMYPSCRFSIPSEEAKEGEGNSIELQGSGGENKRSNLPMKFTKTIAKRDYGKFVE